ncbi:hypothetical protein RRG08_030923 [Elysia crispata]|uniref:Uncharacterized protein n=1 Tax=Elysia crispata TaxID=231223 RepID=A0AAE1AAS6_9GAST|nr:hypothetical protein RRG08_030923 [Elysia crispata]
MKIRLTGPPPHPLNPRFEGGNKIVPTENSTERKKVGPSISSISSRSSFLYIFVPKSAFNFNLICLSGWSLLGLESLKFAAGIPEEIRKENIMSTAVMKPARNLFFTDIILRNFLKMLPKNPSYLRQDLKYETLRLLKETICSDGKPHAQGEPTQQSSRWTVIDADFVHRLQLARVNSSELKVIRWSGFDSA